jgi:hypothetical protein
MPEGVPRSADLGGAVSDEPEGRGRVYRRENSWPYENWRDFARTGLRRWVNDEMHSAEEDAFLDECRNNIEAVLWATYFAAVTRPLQELEED